jgi:uncharacterized protein
MKNHIESEKIYQAALTKMQSEANAAPAVLLMLERAHELGNAKATYALGTWYFGGKDNLVPIDKKKSFALFREAAEKGEACANYDLAVSYATGAGTRKNQRLAFFHFTKAALLGDADAAKELGRRFFYGEGVPTNRRVGWLWIDYGDELRAKNWDDYKNSLLVK